MRRTRTAIAYCGLLASVLLSHAIGGGSFISAPSIIAFSILLVGVLSISMPQQLEGPHLALLILISQTLGHFAFGGGAIDASMGTSHIIGALIGYRLVISFDQIICGLENLVRRILMPLRIRKISISEFLFGVTFQSHKAQVKEFTRAAHYLLRAPPCYIVN